MTASQNPPEKKPFSLEEKDKVLQKSNEGLISKYDKQKTVIGRSTGSFPESIASHFADISERIRRRFRKVGSARDI